MHFPETFRIKRNSCFLFKNEATLLLTCFPLNHDLDGLSKTHTKTHTKTIYVMNVLYSFRKTCHIFRWTCHAAAFLATFWTNILPTTMSGFLLENTRFCLLEIAPNNPKWSTNRKTKWSHYLWSSYPAMHLPLKNLQCQSYSKCLLMISTCPMTGFLPQHVAEQGPFLSVLGIPACVKRAYGAGLSPVVASARWASGPWPAPPWRIKNIMPMSIRIMYRIFNLKIYEVYCNDFWKRNRVCHCCSF